MARGRALFSEHRRRAASVPVDDLTYPDATTTRRVFDIKSHVNNDTDAMMSASKRHDRDFLYSIQSKLARPAMASIPLKAPPPTVNHNKFRGPPPSRSAYYAAAVANTSPTFSHVGHTSPTFSHVSHTSPAPARDSRRRTWYGPTTKRVDDYEVAAYLAMPTRPPFVSRVLRGGSVPPVLPSTAAVSTPRWYPSYRGASVPRWAPSTYRTYGSGRSYLQSHPDQEDIVVGVAPTALYGDIVIGIPYRKQFMFDVQHGLDSVEDYPRIPVATRVTPPHFAHRTKAHWESPYEDVDVTPYRRATYSTPNYATAASSYGYPSTHYLGQSSGIRTPLTTAGSRISTYAYPVRSSSARPAATRAEYDIEPKETFSNLRLRANLVHDRAKQHKSMIDKYMPVDDEFTTVKSRGLTSAIRITPSVDLRATGTTHRPPISTAAPPPPAAAPAAGATSQPFKPQISETRQRVRQLLCKSKKDPHYFD